MIFKNALFSLALLYGAAAERNDVLRRPDVERSLAEETPGLSIDEFLKVFDDAISDMSKGSGGRRKLQEEVVQTIDGEVTKDEVVAALTSLTKSTDGQKAKFPDCLALFKYFDKNGDGVLDISELVALFKYAGFGIPLSNQLATALLLWYDKHPKDGVLSMKEIVAACKGDFSSSDFAWEEPHFVTWYGSHFSYHGACDLVLVSNPSFALGKGLDIHVRTKHMTNQQYSFVSNAAVRIGDDVLEVVDDGSHFINGVLNAELPATLGGFAITKNSQEVCKGRDGDRCAEVINFFVSLAGGDAIRIKVASNMLHVDVKGSDENFQGSVGLMGTYPAEHHGKIARDGVTFLREADTFSEEWQVLESEPKLFQEARFPQHPQVCTPAIQPPAAQRALREVEDKEARLAAEEACAHVEGYEWEFCVFDVMATGDYGMAATIYGDV